MFVRRGRRVVRLCVWSDYRRAVSLDPGGDWSLPHQEGSTGVNGSLAYRRKKVSGELTADRNTNASHLRGNRALLVTSSLTFLSIGGLDESGTRSNAHHRQRSVRLVIPCTVSKK